MILQPVEVFVLHKIDYQRLFAGSITGTLKEKVDYFRMMPIFRQMSEVALYRMGYAFKIYRANRGDTIVTEGEEADRIYFLKFGHCRLLKKAKENNTSIEISSILDGDHIGVEEVQILLKLLLNFIFNIKRKVKMILMQRQLHCVNKFYIFIVSTTDSI